MKGPTPSKPSPCCFCKLSFSSRNALFRHLRNLVSECGKRAAAENTGTQGIGLHDSSPNSEPKSKSKNNKKQQGRSKRKTQEQTDKESLQKRSRACPPHEKNDAVTPSTRIVNTSPHESSGKDHGRNSDRKNNELWFGDIPPAFSSVKKLKQLLYTQTPAGSSQPHIKRFVKKVPWQKHTT